jgi:maltose O-acetyltransferase
LYRLASFSVGSSAILSEVYVGGPNLTIGDGCFINRRCLFDAGAEIVLEDRVYLAYGVSIITGTHQIGGPAQRASVTEFHPVRIGSGSWLGANVTVLPGVTVASGCVIAAGAMVIEDTERDGLYAGVPARRIRDLPRAVTVSRPVSGMAQRPVSLPGGSGQGGH